MYTFIKIRDSKSDRQMFENFAGKALSDRFYKQQQRMPEGQKDIYYWMKRPKEELEKKVEELENTVTIKNYYDPKYWLKRANEFGDDGAKKVYEDENWIVYKIESYEAAIKYGNYDINQWCISDPAHAHWWTDYKDKGAEFYFYLNKRKGFGQFSYALEYYNKDDYTLWVSGIDKKIRGGNGLPKVDGLPDLTYQEYDRLDNIARMCCEDLGMLDKLVKELRLEHVVGMLYDNDGWLSCYKLNGEEPIFKSKDELIDWLISYADLDRDTATKEVEKRVGRTIKPNDKYITSDYEDPVQGIRSMSEFSLRLRLYNECKNDWENDEYMEIDNIIRANPQKFAYALNKVRID